MDIERFLDREAVWLIIGFAGQSLFFTRFLLQWFESERRQRSVIPRAFWFFSLGGAALLLSYALYRRDPVFIAGQSLGFLVYSRNLWFIYRGPGTGASPAPE